MPDITLDQQLIFAQRFLADWKAGTQPSRADLSPVATVAHLEAIVETLEALVDSQVHPRPGVQREGG